MAVRVQFSIRLLLMATAAIAAVFAAAVPEPTWQMCIAMEFLAILFASISVMAAVKCHGGLRIFWIAAAAPSSIAAVTFFVYGCITGMSGMSEPAYMLPMVVGGLRLVLPVIWCLSLANGAVCWSVWAMMWAGRNRG